MKSKTSPQFYAALSFCMIGLAFLQLVGTYDKKTLTHDSGAGTIDILGPVLSFIDKIGGKIAVFSFLFGGAILFGLLAYKEYKKGKS